MTTQKTSFRSLKVKLIAMCMGIVALLGLASFLLMAHLEQSTEDSRMKTMNAYALSLGDAISAQFYERYGDVQAFAMNPDLRASERSTIVNALNAYSALYGIYDLIMVVDARGRLIAVNDKGPDGKEIAVKALYEKSFSDEAWFKSAMAGQFTEDKERNYAGTLFEDVHIDPYVSAVLGGKRLTTSFTAPIKDASGKAIGVVTNRAGFRWLEVAFKEVFANLKTAGLGQSDLEFLSKDGTLLFELNQKILSATTDEARYDLSTLLKLNLATSGNAAAMDAVAGKTGAKIVTNTRTNIPQITGYTRIQSAKLPPQIGWSVLVRDDLVETMGAFTTAMRIFYVTLGLTMAFGALFAGWFSTRLSNQLTNLAMRLAQGSSEISDAANQVADSSSKLSDSVSEQAAAIQETAASIDEVSAMAKKSADNAGQASGISQESRDAAERGQKAINDMVAAIEEINSSNSQIMAQVESGNRQISDIVKVIADIETKTKVINDIVFQTKLLSFNASVEAARAGEHGKGFAVVAEEVGNLAQMSGNAAKEISSMLESSIRTVDGIVSQTKSQVDRLIGESKTRAEAGNAVARRCSDALENIISSVQQVDGMVGEISSASNEQALGVSEVNKAINQLDRSTQQNATVAQSAASAAGQLTAQSANLNTVVQRLLGLVNGFESDGREEQSKTKPPMKHEAAKVLKFSDKPAAPKAAGAPAKVAAPRVSAASAAAPDVTPASDDPRFEEI